MRIYENITVVLILVFSAFTVSMFISEPGAGATLKVGKDQTYERIQWAIDNATSGDVIEVHAGTYVENIDIDVSITLKGNGTGKTTINGEGGDHVISVSVSSVTIEGMDITAGTQSGSLASVYIDSGFSGVTVKDCSLTNSYYGLRAYGTSSSQVSRIIVENCDVNDNYYGVYLYYATNSRIANSTCEYNYYGTYIYGSSTASASKIFIENNDLSYNEYGVRMYYTLYSFIRNNTIDGNENYGIYLSSSDYDLIENNSIDKSLDEAIYLTSSDHNIVKENMINNSYTGIYITGSDYNTVFLNDINNTEHYPMYLSSADHNEIHNNSIRNGEEYGLYYSSGTYNILRNNSFEKCGIYLISSTESNWQNTIIDRYNTVNGRPVYFYYDVDDKKITRAGQVLLYKSDNINVTDSNLSDSTVGLTMYYSTGCTIKDNDMNGNRYGIYAYGSSTIKLVNTIITGNEVYDCPTGIRLYYMYYSQVDNNTVRGSVDYGIYVSSSDYNLIQFNTVSDTVEKGIYLTSSDYLDLNNNTIHNNKEAGIQISSGSSNEYRNNNFTKCGLYLITTSSTYWSGNDVDRSNTVNGNPLYFLYQKKDMVISDAGQVLMYDCDFITIENCDLSWATNGIVLYYSANIYVYNTTADHNYYPVYAYGKSTDYIQYCKFRNVSMDFGYYGIRLYYADYNMFDGCSFEYDEEYGVYLYQSDHNKFSNNTFVNCGYPTYESGNYGFYFYSSTYVDLQNNSFTGCGVFFYKSTTTSYWNTHTIRNNEVNGRDLVFLVRVTDYKLTGDAGQVILVDCSSIEIDGHDLSRSTVGLQGAFSSRIIVRNCTANENYYGLWLYVTNVASSGNVFVNNEASRCYEYGIAIESGSSYASQDNVIIDNTCNYNGDDGIYLYYMRSGLRVENNTCDFNDGDYGFYIYGSSSQKVDKLVFKNNHATGNNYGAYLYYCTNSVVSGNELSGNSNRGLHFYYGDNSVISRNTALENDDYGFYIYDTDAPVIENNTAGFNGLDGMYVYKGLTSGSNEHIAYNIFFHNGRNGLDLDSGYHQVHNNTFYENTDFGLWVDGTYADYNVIVHNTFRDNNNGLSQAHDDETGNSWDNGNEGNYWMDHQTPDSNSDGIVDDSYSIEGSASSMDRYPLVSYNTAPTITIKDDTTADEDSAYSVDYAATDPNSNEVQFWALETGPEFLSIDMYTGVLSGIPDNDDVGTHSVNVSVYDRAADYDYSVFTLMVSNVNDPPTITTDDVTSVYAKDSYSVDYDAVDPDPTSDTLTWALSTNAGFLSITRTTGLLSGAPLSRDVGSWWVNVSVSDGNGGEDWTNFTLEVLSSNTAPSITGSYTTTTSEDILYSVDFDVTDPDTGDIHAWSLDTDAKWLRLVPTTGLLSGTPTNRDVGNFYVNVSVDDGNGGSDWLNYTLTVRNTNDEPVITTKDIISTLEDEYYYNDYDATDEDPTGDTLSWSLKTNCNFLSIDKRTGELSGTPGNGDVGRFSVEVTVDDGNGGNDIATFMLSVENVNDPPEIVNEIVTDAVEDHEYRLDFQAIDIDPTMDRLSWSVITLLDVLDIDRVTGVLSGTPTNEHVGDWAVNVSVNDGNGGLDWVEYILTVHNTNDDPLITTSPKTAALEDEEYWCDFDAVDVDPTGDTLTWSLDEGPDFLVIDSTTGNLTGVPGNDEVGSYRVTVNVSDGNDGWDTATFTLNVLNVNDPPMILTNFLPDATEEQNYWIILSGDDIDAGDILYWSIDTETDFLDIDRSTGNLSGTPDNDDVGDWWVLITLEDASGEYVELNLTLKVMNVNDDPYINVSPAMTADEDEPYWFVFTAEDVDPTGDTFQWSLLTNAEFLSIDGSTGNLSGTPENDDVGDWWVNVTVKDDFDGTSFLNFTLTVVNVNDAPTITSENVLSATEDELFFNVYTAVDIDPTMDDLAWSVDTDADFLSIGAATGNLSGIPENDDVGEWWVNVTVTDEHGASSFVNFTLNVVNVNDGPELNISALSGEINEDGDAYTTDLKDVFIDPDGQELSYQYTGSDNFTVSIDGTMITINPKPDWSGSEIITITASDGEEEISIDLTMTVSNVNDAPTNPVVTEREEYVAGGDQTVSATADDPDLPYGDALTFSWSSDLTGQIGTGQEINLSLPKGKHTITLTVTDSAGESATTTFEVEVVKKKDGDGIPVWIIILIVAAFLVILLLMVLFLLLRKKKEPEQEQPPAEEIPQEIPPMGSPMEYQDAVTDALVQVYGGGITQAQPQYPTEPEFPTERIDDTDPAVEEASYAPSYGEAPGMEIQPPAMEETQTGDEYEIREQPAGASGDTSLQEAPMQPFQKEPDAPHIQQEPPVPVNAPVLPDVPSAPSMPPLPPEPPAMPQVIESAEMVPSDDKSGGQPS
ncbi:MAG: right-handed parallel beta-helix repeat-containing protein [Thermoplasmatota archaeon]